jgi:hypothetical protein
MNRLPKTVFATLIIIMINAAFWLIYTFIMAFGGVSSIASASTVKWVMAILALSSSVALAGITFFLARRNRLAFFFGVVLLTIIAILSITDEFGILDLFSLLVSIVPLGLMIRDRAWYLKSNKNS